MTQTKSRMYNETFCLLIKSNFVVAYGISFKSFFPNCWTRKEIVCKINDLFSCIMFILVRTVHTINFCLLYFVQHQKIALRDFEKLQGALLAMQSFYS